jgi:hypothetical protein
MKVGISIGKVKKFEIGWCIPHRMAADNAEGGSMQTPLLGGIGLKECLPADFEFHARVQKCHFVKFSNLSCA